MEDKLKGMNEAKLVDIAKNYQRYGYDENIKNQALELLEKRGFNTEDIKLMGQEKTINFELAKSQLRLFNRNSILAFIFYIIAVIVSIYFLTEAYNELMESLVKLGLYGIYLSFMIWSVVNLKNYYEIVRKDDYSMDMLIYTFFGIPFYALAFIYTRSKMKEELDRI